MYFIFLAACLLNSVSTALLLLHFFKGNKKYTISKTTAWYKAFITVMVILCFRHYLQENIMLLILSIITLVADGVHIVLKYLSPYVSKEKINLNEIRFVENDRFNELWQSSPSYLFVKGIRLRLYINENWNYQSADGKYKTSIAVAEGNILIEQAQGEVTIENAKAGLDLVEYVVKYLQLENRTYYYIADTTKISKASFSSRNLVIEFHERNKNLKQFVLITNGFTRVLLKLMSPINPEVINNWKTSDTIENAVHLILQSGEMSAAQGYQPETLLEKRVEQLYSMISKMSLRKFDEIEPVTIPETDPLHGVFTALDILKNDNRETLHELSTLLDTSYETVRQQQVEILTAKYESLKNQINPHFLFNSLNVLIELIYKNQDEAVDFVKELSNIYRYILRYMNEELVTIETEIEFIRSYSYLLKIRYGENINIHIEWNTTMEFMIPPLTLQLLIENCTKHNIATAESPLNIYISEKNQYLVVSNNLQVKKTIPHSSMIGLKSIQDRYKYLSDEPVYIINDGTNFTVKLPLLKTKD